MSSRLRSVYMRNPTVVQTSVESLRVLFYVSSFGQSRRGGGRIGRSWAAAFDLWRPIEQVRGYCETILDVSRGGELGSCRAVSGHGVEASMTLWPTTQIKTQLRADVDVASFFFFASASARASEASARPRDRVRGPFEPVDFPTECSLAASSSSSSPPSTGQSGLNWNGASVQHISSPNLRNQRIRTCYKQRCRDAAREPGARAESANVAYKFVESRTLRKAQVRLQCSNGMQIVTIRIET